MLELSTENYWADLLHAQMTCKHERRKGVWIAGVGIEQCLDCGRALSDYEPLGKGQKEGEVSQLPSPSLSDDRCMRCGAEAEDHLRPCGLCGMYFCGDCGDIHANQNDPPCRNFLRAV